MTILSLLNEKLKEAEVKPCKSCENLKEKDGYYYCQQLKAWLSKGLIDKLYCNSFIESKKKEVRK